MNEDQALTGFLRFGRHLRAHGISVAPAKMRDVIATLPYCDLHSPDEFYWMSRALLVQRQEDLQSFEDAFQSFWKPQPPPNAPEPSPHALPRSLKAPMGGDEGQLLGRPDVGEPQNRRYAKATRLALMESEPGDGEGGGLLSYSAGETLRYKDFAYMEPHEMDDARKLLVRMRWPITRRRSRRLVPAYDGRNTDWRRVLRRSMQYGGTPLVLTFAKPKEVRRPVILLCDVSGSMDRYTRLLLHFIHTITAASGNKLEAFVFGTRLTRVTREISARNIDAALVGVSKRVRDWSGGTRIGDSLADFNRTHARRLLGRGAVAVVVSDGWDKGDPQVLQCELERLRRRCHRLIWINPSLGVESQRPMAAGMHAALHHVDDFLAVSNLHSLAQLGSILSSLRVGRPSRAPKASLI
ncbi:MAG: VWA domain-containing protein [Candidatus Eremiobacteraeota bacterium]|nr:VWA domain-containing protein [Candidatus Eremiobacteraeota bacterium]